MKNGGDYKPILARKSDGFICVLGGHLVWFILGEGYISFVLETHPIWAFLQ